MTEHFDPKRLLSYLFILAIAVLFALQWGPGARGCDTPLTRQRGEVAATVNSKDIPLREFQTAYANQLNYMRQQGSPLPPALAKQLGIPSQVMDQLVNTELLAQEAEKMGILPADKEVRDLIQKNPDFQKDGKFDFARYREILRDYYRRTDVDYETDLRRRIAANKLLDVVESAAVVSDDEVKARYQKEHNRAKATLVRFLPAMFTDKVGTPKPDELAAFAKAHPKEISDYYEANRYLYHQQERVRARHILLKVAPDATAAQKDEVKKRLEELRAQITGGKDFALAAKEFSEDLGTKEKGGDLGLSERGAWELPFAEAAFALEEGAVSQPVETRYGFHLIKVEEKKAPQKKELSEVEPEISKTLWTKDKSKELARAAAAKALESAQRGKKLTELYPATEEAQGQAMRFETEKKPEAIDTGEFTASSDSLPRVGAAPEIVRDAMALEKPAPLSKVYEVGEGFAVVAVNERSRPTEEQFAAQKEKLRDEARQAKQFELRDAYLKALKKQSTVVVNDEALAKSGDEG